MTRPNDPPQERITELASRLGIEVEAPKPGGEALLVWQFVPMVAGLPGWRSEPVRRLPIEGWPATTRSAWRPIEGEGQTGVDDVLLMLDTHECADATDARDWLLRALGGVQSTAIERLRRNAPGELAVGMPQGGMLAFARANLVCLLRNGGRSVQPVTEAARSLDGWIAERPDAGGRLAPEIVGAEAVPGPEGDQVTIQVEAREPADRDVWFKLVAPTGSLSLVEGTPRYRPEAGVGPTTLTLYAVGPGGVATESIEVTPENTEQTGS